MATANTASKIMSYLPGLGVGGYVMGVTALVVVGISVGTGTGRGGRHSTPLRGHSTMP